MIYDIQYLGVDASRIRVSTEMVLFSVWPGFSRSCPFSYPHIHKHSYGNFQAIAVLLAHLLHSPANANIWSEAAGFPELAPHSSKPKEACIIATAVHAF